MTSTDQHPGASSDDADQAGGPTDEERPDNNALASSA